jgi:hypothetical protein
MPTKVLGLRELNRATLARQLLLDRVDLPASEAIEHLVGLQAQAPNAAYVGLWSRLSGFQATELASLASSRAVVRTHLHRCTIHLVTARDCLALHPVFRPVLDRSWTGSPFSKNVVGLDLAELRAFGTALITDRPRSRAELAPLLSARFPGRDPDSLVYAITYLTPVVQVPPRGVWGSTGPSMWSPISEFLGAPTETSSVPDSLVLRYLAAFGPTSVMDIQKWSGLTRLREVVDRLRSGLVVFNDVTGRELFDLPDAPRPDEDVVAPPRFLPEYDNILLGHADRSRVNPARNPIPLWPGNGAAMGNLLVDGVNAATWRITRAKDMATLTVKPFSHLSRKDSVEVEAEGYRLLDFAAAGAGRYDVVVTPAER